MLAANEEAYSSRRKYGNSFSVEHITYDHIPLYSVMLFIDDLWLACYHLKPPLSNKIFQNVGPVYKHNI